MNKFERQGAILRVVQEQELATQAEARRRAPRAGLQDVVQTTVSRDIAQLGLVKVRDEDGGSSTRSRAPPTSTAWRS